jgi:pimeloyl-ACP methyl ester carboxylesterase
VNPTTVLGAAVLAAASFLPGAPLASAEDPGPEKPPGPFAEEVSFPTDDGMTIHGTYWSGEAPPPPPPPAPSAFSGRAGKPDAPRPPPASTGPKPALVLVHGEGSTRAAFGPLIPRLIEHRIPALAIDLRGHGASETQGGKRLGPLVARKDEATLASMWEDVKAAVRFLVKTRGHDPARVGAIAAGLGAAVALDAGRRHPEDWTTLMLLTPQTGWPGLDVEAWMKTFVGPIAGRIVINILSSVEDADKGPRKLLYTLEYARNPPPKTPDALKAERRRGVYPRYRGLADTGVTGTAMFGRVKQIEAWIAAWFARTWGTYPHPVLFDGSVDKVGDYADPSWEKGVTLPSGGAGVARALRWGRRMMVGGEVPMDVIAVRVRSRASRGDVEVGQYAELDYRNASVIAQPMLHVGARHPPIEILHLLLQGDPGYEGVAPVNPSFETEIRLPPLPGKEPYEVRASWGYVRGDGTEVNAPGMDPAKPETWTVVDDLDAPP